jgi:hypothetical protein
MGRVCTLVRMAGEWVGLGVSARRALHARNQACAWQLAVSAGYVVVPMPSVYSWRDGKRLYVAGFSGIALLRKQVALEFANGLIEREGLEPRDERDVVTVARTLIFPPDEAAHAYHDAGYELDTLIEQYAEHVPDSWIADAIEAHEDAHPTLMRPPVSASRAWHSQHIVVRRFRF